MRLLGYLVVCLVGCHRWERERERKKQAYLYLYLLLRD
jgi:hypothetical protein